MISTMGRPPAARRLAAASRSERTCMRYRPSFSTPRRTPGASMGCLLPARARRAGRSPPRRGRPRGLLTTRLSTLGRTRAAAVEEPHGDGSPSMASRSPRSLPAGPASSSRAAASPRGCWPGSCGGRRETVARNMCSVRQSPMPSAPCSRARAASSACRRWLGRPARGAHLVGPGETVSNSAGFPHGEVHGPEDHLTGVPSMESRRLVDHGVADAEVVVADEDGSAPQTAACPPTGHHRSMADEATARREDALRHLHAVDILG